MVGGHIPASVNPLSESMPLAPGGSIRILAVTGAKRSQFLPDVPTMKESGFDVVVESWPRRIPGTGEAAPADVVRALSKAAMEDASKSAAMKDSLAQFAEARGDVPRPAGAVRRNHQGRSETPLGSRCVKRPSGFVAIDG